LKIIDFGALGAPELSAPAGDRVIAGDPQQRVWNLLSSTDGRFHVGEWASSPGTWRVHYTEYEFCHLLEGVVRLTDEQGVSRVFRAGDSFVIDRGFRGIWEVIEPCRKRYAIYE